MEAREGEILAGKYRVERVLGRGGMGVVVAATHLQLAQRVALKFLLPEALQNTEAVARFTREAQAAVKIKSEHIARVSDVGTLENGSPFMVMEYLEGLDLANWLATRGAMPTEQAVEFVLQGCEAIAEAHALGIVHRDLKPSNLFVVERADGLLSIKVLDFGISKVMGAALPAGMTRTAAILGSPLYMPPEQLQSAKDVDARTDIWALGVVLYELVSGQTPFAADSLPDLMVKIMMGPPASLRAACPHIPSQLESVILRCLAKDRADRYPTIGALANDLLPFAPARAHASVTRISGIMRHAGMAGTVLELPPSAEGRARLPSPSTLATWGNHTNAPGPPRGKALSLAILAAAAVAALTLLLTRHFTAGPAIATVSEPTLEAASVETSPPAAAAPSIAAGQPQPPPEPSAALLASASATSKPPRAPLSKRAPLPPTPSVTPPTKNPLQMQMQ